MTIASIATFLAGVGSIVISGMVVFVGITVIAGAGVAICGGISALLSAGCR